MQRIVTLYKPIGMTPLACIEKYRLQNPEYNDAKLGYAGRLDPMAEGLLLVLVGEENLKRKEYELLSKTYEFEVLFGVETDSYDVLGIPSTSQNQPHIDEQQLLPIISQLAGKTDQPYPPYSSPRVQGKPLFYWARHNRLSEITIPTKEIEIYTATLEKYSFITRQNIQNMIEEKISLVIGDFRQEEIIKAWNIIFLTMPDTLLVAKITISCSSGTYIRTISHNLGKSLETSTLALSIKRTKVGEYDIKDALNIS